MKRFVIAVVSFLFLASAVATAQVDTYKNSIYLTYGGLGLTEVAYFLGTALIGVPAIAIAGDNADIELRMSGNIQFGYARSVTKWLWVGGDLGYEHLGIRASGSDGVSESGADVCTLTASAKADWFRRNKLAMYSKLSAGILGVLNQDDPSVVPAFNITVFGVEGGSPRVRGVIELGVGYSVSVAAGVRYRF